MTTSVPDQIVDPDWGDTQYFAEKAAEAVLEGKMAQANDFFQHLAIAAMDALYGPSSVAKFIKLAMDQDEAEQKEKSRIVLA